VKTYLKLFLPALICLLIISSCKKEIDYHPEWDVATMSGKVDGTLLTCTVASAQFFTSNGKTTLQIIGNKGEAGFSLMVDDFKGAGTYNLTDNNLATYLATTNGLQDAFLSSSAGAIKITSYTPDKIIKGTFEFKGENIFTSTTKTITEGQFSMSLIPSKLPQTNPAAANLNATIDGASTGFTGEAVSITSPIGKLLTITTVSGDKRLVLSIIGYTGIGTYDIAKDGTAVYMKDQTPAGSFYAESGTLVITSEESGKLKGTFAFKGPNQNGTFTTSVSVTNGSFDLPYSKK